MALRLVAEREDEVRGFSPQEYWTVGATLRTKAGVTLQVGTASQRPLPHLIPSRCSAPITD